MSGHPSVAWGVGAVLAALLPARLRWVAMIGAPVAAAWMLAGLDEPSGEGPPVRLFGVELMPVHADRLAMVFAIVFALLGGLGMLFALHERSRAGVVAAMVYVGGAIAVVLAGDLVTFFLAWEVMAVASAVIVFTGRMPGSHRAAWEYMLVHAAGGGAMLLGIVLHAWGIGSLMFGELASSPGAAWLLAGLALHAAVPPLHAWLTEAYPKASAAGAVFLSAFTTKAAVYGLLRGFAGMEVLAWWGAAMALYGVVFAVLENDIRRLLAYHIVSQVGYMVCGVGMGTALALDGAAAHAFCHILYKGLLFMGAGAVVYATGRCRLTELGGLARHMPGSLLWYTVGAFSISGVPLFNGFVSKSMVVAAAEHSHRYAVELMLIGASIGTFFSTALKLPWFTFFDQDRGARPQRPLPWNMVAAMVLVAALCVGIGVAPGRLYALLPRGGEGYEPYTAHHVVTSLQLLLGTAVAFAALIRVLGGEPTRTRDAHLVYRAVGEGTLGAVERGLGPLLERVARAVDGGAAVVAWAAERLGAARLRPVGIWIAVVLVLLAALAVATESVW